MEVLPHLFLNRTVESQVIFLVLLLKNNNMDTTAEDLLKMQVVLVMSLIRDNSVTTQYV